MIQKMSRFVGLVTFDWNAQGLQYFVELNILVSCQLMRRLKTFCFFTNLLSCLNHQRIVNINGFLKIEALEEDGSKLSSPLLSI